MTPRLSPLSQPITNISIKSLIGCFLSRVHVLFHTKLCKVLDIQFFCFQWNGGKGGGRGRGRLHFIFESTALFVYIHFIKMSFLYPFYLSFFFLDSTMMAKEMALNFSMWPMKTKVKYTQNYSMKVCCPTDVFLASKLRMSLNCMFAWCLVLNSNILVYFIKS